MFTYFWFCQSGEKIYRWISQNFGPNLRKVRVFNSAWKRKFSNFSPTEVRSRCSPLNCRPKNSIKFVDCFRMKNFAVIPIEKVVELRKLYGFLEFSSRIFFSNILFFLRKSSHRPFWDMRPFACRARSLRISPKICWLMYFVGLCEFGLLIWY